MGGAYIKGPFFTLIGDGLERIFSILLVRACTLAFPKFGLIVRLNFGSGFSLTCGVCGSEGIFDCVGLNAYYKILYLELSLVWVKSVSCLPR